MLSQLLMPLELSGPPSICRVDLLYLFEDYTTGVAASLRLEFALAANCSAQLAYISRVVLCNGTALTYDISHPINRVDPATLELGPELTPELAARLVLQDAALQGSGSNVTFVTTTVRRRLQMRLAAAVALAAASSSSAAALRQLDGGSSSTALRGSGSGASSGASSGSGSRSDSPWRSGLLSLEGAAPGGQAGGCNDAARALAVNTSFLAQNASLAFSALAPTFGSAMRIDLLVVASADALQNLLNLLLPPNLALQPALPGGNSTVQPPSFVTAASLLNASSAASSNGGASGAPLPVALPPGLLARLGRDEDALLPFLEVIADALGLNVTDLAMGVNTSFLAAALLPAVGGAPSASPSAAARPVDESGIVVASIFGAAVAVALITAVAATTGALPLLQRAAAQCNCQCPRSPPGGTGRRKGKRTGEAEEGDTPPGAGTSGHRKGQPATAAAAVAAAAAADPSSASQSSARAAATADLIAAAAAGAAIAAAVPSQPLAPAPAARHATLDAPPQSPSARAGRGSLASPSQRSRPAPPLQAAVAAASASRASAAAASPGAEHGSGSGRLAASSRRTSAVPAAVLASLSVYARPSLRPLPLSPPRTGTHDDGARPAAAADEGKDE